MSLRRAARRIIGHILDFFLPPVCACCGEDVQSHGLLCPTCFTTAAPISDLSCRRCGVPFVSAEHAGPDRICVDCHRAPPPWQDARAAFLYDDWSRRLILPLKYADRLENARVLAAFMIRAGRAQMEKADLVIPVPLHRRRLWKRRYNQAAVMARLIARAGGIRYLGNGLIRTRMTAPLARLTPREREAQIAGAFSVRPSCRDAIAGRRVLLVDDVLTTGVTAGFCAKALLEAGAVSVSVLVAARAANPEGHTPPYLHE